MIKLFNSFFWSNSIIFSGLFKKVFSDIRFQTQGEYLNFGLKALIVVMLIIIIALLMSFLYRYLNKIFDRKVK